MNMRTTLLASTVAFGLGLAATQASAITFTGSFDVTSNQGSGLVVNTAPNVASNHDVNGNSSGFTFNLNNVNQSVTFNLFDIWTNETGVGGNTNSRPISVAFSFTQPLPEFGGTSEGTTVAGSIFVLSWGSVSWGDDPTLVSFGELGDGLLEVSLSNETFNGGGGLGLNPGQENGATVEVTFKLKHKATESNNPPTQVPEPATLTLLGMGLLGLGAIRRRKAA